MRPATKMLMVSSTMAAGDRGGNTGRRESGDRSGGNRGVRNNYDTYEVQDYDRSSGQRSMGGADPAVDVQRRYRRYKDGRFRPNSRMDGDDDDDMMDDMDGAENHMPYPYGPPPIYEITRRERSEPRQDDRRMNQIGFSAARMGGDMEHDDHHMEHGGADGRAMKFDRETAEEWMGGIKNSDGTKGPHWTMAQTQQVMTQRGFDCDPVEFWAVMNAVYSDYCKVAKKHNVNTVDFYADMAKAWLHDSDAAPNKAAAYFAYVVK